jgi:predicted nucleotidyltransferase
MELEKGRTSALNEVVRVVSEFTGVVAIILFGSLARGDYDEFSDYDLLVLFEERELMWRSWSALFEAVGKLGLNLHLIPETMEELRSSNPAFADNISEHGKVLYARWPFEVHMRRMSLEPFSLIFYDMSGVDYRTKMKCSYLLYRKGGEGLLHRLGGMRLGEACVLVPAARAGEVVRKLDALGVKTKKLEVFAERGRIVVDGTARG